jgi:dienelactone hydrolase
MYRGDNMEIRRMCGPGLTAAVVLGAGLLCSSVVAQNQAPAARTPTGVLPVTANLRGAPPSGPFAVVIEHDQTLATHTIYRPAMLGSAKHPVLVWGEGGCAKDGLQFPEFLNEIASHGFVVIADGPPVGRTAPGGGPEAAPGAGAPAGGPAPPAAGGAPPVGAARAAGAPPAQGGQGRGGVPQNMTDGTALIAAIEWIAKQGNDRASRFYQTVETNRLAVMGMSCGGLMSYGASADPRVATVGIWNSGLIQPDEKIFAGLHSPVIIITGGEKDIAYANGKRDFETMPAKIPVFYGVHPSVGHGGTYNEDNGGAFGVAAVAWLKWQLMNDTSAKGKGYFVGAGCGICGDGKWQTASRALQ